MQNQHDSGQQKSRARTTDQSQTSRAFVFGWAFAVGAIVLALTVWYVTSANAQESESGQEANAAQQTGDNAPSAGEQRQRNQFQQDPQATGEPQMESITFGGGCFWCTEAVFQELQGVLSVESGYSNGNSERFPNPTYRDVCSGMTGYVEVIRVNYDPAQVEVATLLEVFFKTHDPTTLNRQGADVGTQYRSGVYYHTDQQKELAEYYIARLNESGAYSTPIVTEVEAIADYLPAEDYHQNYFSENPNQGYCRAVIQPKMEKFREAFADKLKD